MTNTIIEVFKNFYRDKGTFLASAIAFSASFSMFPLLLLTAAIFGFFMESTVLRESVLTFFSANAPLAIEFVQNNVDRMIVARGSMGTLAGAFLLWAGISVFAAVESGLNAVFHVDTPRHILLQKLVAVLVVALAAMLALLSIGATFTLANVDKIIAARLSGKSIELALAWRLASGIAAYAIGTAVAFLMFVVIYKLVPNRKISFKNIWRGAVFAAVCWEASKALLGYLVENIVKYSLVYGSLGSAIVFLTWVYVSALVLIIGAELIKIRIGYPAVDRRRSTID